LVEKEKKGYHFWTFSVALVELASPWLQMFASSWMKVMKENHWNKKL